MYLAFHRVKMNEQRTCLICVRQACQWNKEKLNLITHKDLEKKYLYLSRCNEFCCCEMGSIFQIRPNVNVILGA